MVDCLAGFLRPRSAQELQYHVIWSTGVRECPRRCLTCKCAVDVACPTSLRSHASGVLRLWNLEQHEASTFLRRSVAVQSRVRETCHHLNTSLWRMTINTDFTERHHQQSIILRTSTQKSILLLILVYTANKIICKNKSLHFDRQLFKDSRTECQT